MADLDDLQSRAGSLVQALSDSDDRHEDLLSGIQANLSTVRDRLIQKKLEYDQLATENRQLKQVIEHLLQLLEGKSTTSHHDRLKDLNIQLSALLELSQDEAQTADLPLGAASVKALEEKPSDAAEGTAAVSPQHMGLSAVLEPASLEEIQRRVHKLTERLDDEPAAPAAIGPEPSPQEAALPRLETQPNAEAAQVAADTQTKTAATAPAPPKGESPRPSPGGVAHWASRVLGAGSTAAPAPRKTTHKVLKHLDAEVEYALSILHRLKRQGQHFSVEEVRDLINGKFNLNLTKDHDREIAASLSNQPHVTRDARRHDLWQFGREG